jgi:hypothetical protein
MRPTCQPVEQDERAGGADVPRQAGVVQAAAQVRPAVVFADRGGDLAGAAFGDRDVAGEPAGAGPVQELPGRVGGLGRLAGQPAVDVCLGEIGEADLFGVEPGQQPHGGADAGAGPAGRLVGECGEPAHQLQPRPDGRGPQETAALLPLPSVQHRGENSRGRVEMGDRGIQRQMRRTRQIHPMCHTHLLLHPVHHRCIGCRWRRVSRGRRRVAIGPACEWSAGSPFLCFPGYVGCCIW